MFLVQVLLALVSLAAGQIPPQPRVTIEQGTLVGTYQTSSSGRQYAAFRGVPYAQPPVGKLRFKEPKAPKPWTGVYPATEGGPECLQYSHMTYQVQGDEDCLHINVYTPKLPADEQTSLLLDVIVYIHGGAFMFLNGDSFGARYLLDKDFVFVNFNYRLGPLGFLTTEDTILSGNNGLKDQSAALRWVQRNIKAFGGNPASVTLVGLSAGGVSVHYHYLSPLSQGLFSRGISISGTVLCSWAISDNGREKALQLGANLGCNTANSNQLVDCLRNRPAHRIVQQSKQFMKWLYNPYSPFGPTVEVVGSKSPFLTQDPYKILKSGQYQQLPWITSVTSEEGLYPGAEICSSRERLTELDNNWNELLPHLLDFNLTVDPEHKDDVCYNIKKYYMQNKTALENSRQLIQMIGDRLFVSCGEEAAKLQAKTSKAPVYFYYFTYRGSSSLSNALAHNEENYGVSHGDDVFYFVNSSFSNPEATKNDKEMSNRMVDLVTSFASNGIPNFTPTTKFPTVKEGLPALKYIHVKSPKEFVQEQKNSLGHSDFWFGLPFHETINIVKQEEEMTSRDEL